MIKAIFRVLCSLCCRLGDADPMKFGPKGPVDLNAGAEYVLHAAHGMRDQRMQHSDLNHLFNKRHDWGTGCLLLNVRRDLGRLACRRPWLADIQVCVSAWQSALQYKHSHAILSWVMKLSIQTDSAHLHDLNIPSPTPPPPSSAPVSSMQHHEWNCCTCSCCGMTCTSYRPRVH